MQRTNVLEWPYVAGLRLGHHHEAGVHARNYGDIPLFDMLFGTFVNPREFDGEVGFHDGGSKKLGAMLAGKLIA